MDKFWANHSMRRHPSQSSHSSTAYKRLPAPHVNISSSATNNNNQTLLPNDAIPMQCLDVGSLLKFNERRDYQRLQCESITEGTVSLIGSSLDLEWEHEHGGDDDDHRQLPASWHCSQNSSSSSSSEAGGCEQSIELSQMFAANTRQPQQHRVNTRRHQQRQMPNLSRPASATNLDGYNGGKSNSSWSHISTPDSLEWDVQEDDRKFRSEEDSLDRETVELLNEIEWLKNRALLETSGEADWSAKCTGESWLWICTRFDNNYTDSIDRYHQCFAWTM